MILILGGTTEGREAARLLASAGWPVLVSVATPYGAELAGRDFAGEVLAGRRDAAGFAALLEERRVAVVVDASHPFAVEARRNARRAAAACRVAYLRFTRPPEPLPGHPLVRTAPDFTAAAEVAVAHGPVIFLATGSKTLPFFLPAARAAGCRVVARVLPEPEAIGACREQGLLPRDIVALQGPVAEELNRALFKAFGATVVVTKESGARGGQGAKIRAALGLGIPVVVVRRPPEEPGALYELAELFEEVAKVLRRRRLWRE
ncbi:MAG: precorrin-6A reductase [Bacillota bacterium]